MNCCLRNSCSILLRRYKPTQPPMITLRSHRLIHTAPRRSRSLEGTDSMSGLFIRRTTSYHRLVSPPRRTSDLWSPPAGRRWYCDPPKVTWGTLLKQEIVPYTNRAHWVIALPDECQLVVDEIKKEHGDNILDPSHPDTIRVCIILNDIINGLHRVLLTKSPCEESSSKDLGPVSNGSQNNKQGKAATLQPHTGHLREVNWRVFIVTDKRVRAYSKWGGKIVMYTGFLDSFDMDAEIATILAHEVGHIVARHFIELAEIAECFIHPFLRKLLPFSRRKEIEADHIGIMLLAAAGFDPRVAPGVYQKLGEIHGDSTWKDYICSHPSFKTRSTLLSQDKIMEKALELYHNTYKFT